MKKLDIKRALREHNMTQVELCKKTGLLTQNMSPIINGNPTISKLFQIAEGIGCDITDLFYPDPTEEAEKEIPTETKSEGTFSEVSEEEESAYPVHSDGLVSENQQQMIQTSTFCPHCGKKVRVGVVLLDS